MAVTPRAAALDILTTLRDAGHTAYFAGGCVRDRLLGLKPTDYDVATDAPPEAVQRLFKRSNAVGAAFGVVLVYHGHGDTPGERIVTEVATFRTDGDYTDGRRPDRVTFTDAEHDAQRRDFTINGLFEDPTELGGTDPEADADGVIDFVGGRADLNTKLIRAIGDPGKRFAEDFLRMLRAVRFAARFGFEIESQTADAIKNLAKELAEIARERIGDEIRRAITGPRPALAARLLFELGLDSAVFGTPTEHLRTDALERIDPAADYATRLAVWLSDHRPKISANRVRETLALSNEESNALQRTVSLFSGRDGAVTVARRKRLLSDPRWPQVLLKVRATLGDALADELDAESRRLAHDGVGLRPHPLLTGDGLIAAGFTPGPAFGPILDAVYDAQLEGRVRTADEALALAKTVQP